VAANSVARALGFIGDRWSLLIIGTAFEGLQRFDEWRRALGIASNILSQRLAHLVAAGCLARAGEARPAYRLTPMGEALYPTALMFWRLDHRWPSATPAAPRVLVHAACGQPMTPEPACGACREHVNAHGVAFAQGPGAGLERWTPPRSTRRTRTPAPPGGRTPTLYGESIEYVGDRWTQLVLASFFLGDHRYEEIRARWHIATNILAGRLQVLVERGLLQRRVYQTRPERSEYVLTPKGMDVYPIALAMQAWADRWLPRDEGPPVVLTHQACGRTLELAVVCSRCRGELHAHEVTFRR
jgi:DNA-binding HxlR family transcriptional regulator